MSRLLHVSASPRGAASESLAIAGTFLDAYREVHGDVVDHFDLWDGTLPAFGPAGPVLANAARNPVYRRQLQALVESLATRTS